jgi:hypothetical protein
MTILCQVSEMIPSGCERLTGLLGDVMRIDYNGHVLLYSVQKARITSRKHACVNN